MQVITYIYKDIIEALDYVPSILWLLIFVIVAVILSGLHYKKKITTKKVMLYFIFIIYLVTMLNYSLLSREPGSRVGMDLDVFSTWGSTMQTHAYFLENIVMFLPIGVLIPAIWKSVNKWWLIILIAVFGSLTLETVQLVTERGFFQTDDIITNTIGGLAGYSVGRLLNRL